MGIVVPHASGARVVVDELVIADAWRGVIEGVPGEKFFDRRLVEVASRYTKHARRVRNVEHPPYTGTRKYPVGWGPPAQHAPRWVVCAASHVVDENEVERALTFAWFTNGPFALSVEELLVSGVHDIPLDGEVPRAPPDGKHAWTAHTTVDEARVVVDELVLSFALASTEQQAARAALRAFAPVMQQFVVVSLFKDRKAIDVGDAPILARAELDGPRIEGPRNPNPAEYIDGMLNIAWIAPAPGSSPIKSIVDDVLANVEWHAMARPSLGP